MLDKLEKILSHHNVFLSGGAGVGKSYLTNELKKVYKNKGKKIIALGSSALSAFNVGGFTLHSFFCLGHCEDFYALSIYDRKQKEKLVKLNKILKTLDLLIIDEISMISAKVFDMLALRIKNSQFSGKFLIVGDFFQLPPVVKDKQKTLFANSYYAFSSLFWQELEFVNLELSTAKRTANLLFYENLSLLRKGVLNEELLTYFEQFLISHKELEHIDNEFTLLCGTNKQANFINQKKLNKISSPVFSFKALIVKQDESLEDEQLKAFLKGLNVLEGLSLKIGARVIFTLNNWEQNYCNGEQGVVEEILNQEDKTYIKITKNNGMQILLEPYTFLMEEISQNTNELYVNIRASVKQFPIKLAYAITIHKSQGMGIEKLVCDVDHIFENGQLYVALSRATEPKYLKIVYSKKMNFKEYFASILKFDENVSEFYASREFLDLEFQGQNDENI